MRRLWRPDVGPPTLTAPGSPAAVFAEGQRNGTLPRDKFTPYWRSPDVRGVLRASCGRACAYCCDLVGRTGEDVEHYRPKNVYWFLAYSPSNYVSSCRRCNSSRKINRFPLESGAAQATTVDRLRSERRLLLDPVVDDVERVLRIELTSKRYEWEVVSTAPKQLRRRAEKTVEFFHLNSDAELVTDRFNAVQDFLAGMVSSDETTRQRTRRTASRFMRHGAALRSILAQQQPALVPTVAEEVQWHLVDCVQILNSLARSPQQPDPDTEMLVRFTLATTWKRPPKGLTRAEVGAWLSDLGVADATEPFVQQLT